MRASKRAKRASDAKKKLQRGWAWCAGATGIARGSRTARLTPLAIAGSVLGAWDMLFSPFAAVTVLALALTVGAVACSAVRREGVEC